jgi:hypothetical protein
MKVLVHYHEIALKGGTALSSCASWPTTCAGLPRHGGQGCARGPAASRWTPDGVAWDQRERVDRSSAWPTSLAHQTALDLEGLKTAAVARLRGRAGSFRVTTKRSFKGFPMTSGEIDREVGGAVHEATGVRVT